MVPEQEHPSSGMRTIPIAVIIPCLNEAQTIASVIRDFRIALPTASIFVIDNGSVDDTAATAATENALVLTETRAGKGNAVRTAFQVIDAEIYLMVDGDGTYPATEAMRLIQPIQEGWADVVIGGRLGAGTGSEFHWLNRLGNRLFLATVNTVFRAQVTDLLTGFRAMSREFVRRSPILSTGFELETELTILALDRGFRTLEVQIRLEERPSGSHSKIHIVRDGFRILSAVFALLRDYRPLTFFGGLGVLSMILGLVPGVFVVLKYFETGLVRIPLAVLATGMEIGGLTLLLTGVTLTTLARRFREINAQLANLERDLRYLDKRRSS